MYEVPESNLQKMSQAVTNSKSEIDQIEKDMAASFEEYRRVEPGTYLAATSAASVLGAQMFVRRFLDWHKHELHQQLEAKTDKAIMHGKGLLAAEIMERLSSHAVDKEVWDRLEYLRDEFSEGQK